MRKYDFDKMGNLWKDHAQTIISNGTFLAVSGSWDMWAYDSIVYSIPRAGSGGACSVWCGVKNLRAHLYRLRQIRESAGLIPEDWQNVNKKFFEEMKIA